MKSARRFRRSYKPKRRFNIRRTGFKRPRSSVSKRTAKRSRYVRKPKVFSAPQTTQWSQRKLRTGRRVKKATLNRRILSASRVYTIYGYRKLKSFDDNGAQPIYSHNPVGASEHYMPMHVYSLNCVRQQDAIPQPARVLYYDSANKVWKWLVEAGLGGATEAAPDSNLQVFKEAPVGYLDRRPCLYHEYTHIKLNLWGAKSKPVKYQIDVVRPLTEHVSPFEISPNTAMSNEGAQCCEEMIKQFTFNPIARLNHYINKKFKVVKSATFVIAPNSLDDGDADANVKTVDWFLRVNRITRFDKITEGDYGGVNTIETIDEVKAVTEDHTNTPLSVFPRTRDNLFLIVRASDYSPESSVFNTNIHASYDIDFRSKFSYL